MHFGGLAVASRFATVPTLRVKVVVAVGIVSVKTVVVEVAVLMIASRVTRACIVVVLRGLVE